MKRITIVVLGGTGFVGSHLIPKLHDAGYSVTLLSRNRENHRELAVLPNLRIETANVYDQTVLERHFRGADVVINLIGLLNEHGSTGAGFRKTHVTLVERIIKACKAANVPRLLQMSALNAGQGESHYLITRGEAELRIKASGLAWTIFQASVIFGPRDGLFFRFAKLLRWIPILPLARPHARFSPVYVADVAQAIAHAAIDAQTIGHTYQVYGPEVISLIDLVRQTAKWCRKKRWVLPLPDALGWLQALVCEFVPGKPLSRDNFRSLKIDSVGSRNGLNELGITATSMRSVMPLLLHSESKQDRLDHFRKNL